MGNRGGYQARIDELKFIEFCLTEIHRIVKISRNNYFVEIVLGH